MHLGKTIMHPRTARLIDAFISNPSNALLITGVRGSGKRYLASRVAETFLGAQIDTYPYFYRITKPEGKQEIPIEAIRQVIKRLQLKTAGKPGVRRIVMIEDAEFLSEEAQNALLKILEEPASDTLFILTAQSAYSVAPTIASRCQQIQVNSLGLAQSLELLQPKYPKHKIVTAWNLSKGAIGLMLALLDGADDHRLKKSVDEAKSWLKLQPDERLVALDRYAKNREDFLQLLDALSRTLAVLQHAAIERGQRRLGPLLGTDRRLVMILSTQVQAGLNLKLATTRLALGIRALV